MSVGSASDQGICGRDGDGARSRSRAGMDANELVKVAGAANEAEAEFVQGVLLDAGVPSVVRRSGGADVPDFLAAGARDVLVPGYLVETARQALPPAGPEPAISRSTPFGSPLQVAAGLVLACVVVALVIWLGTA